MGQARHSWNMNQHDDEGNTIDIDVVNSEVWITFEYHESRVRTTKFLDLEEARWLRLGLDEAIKFIEKGAESDQQP